AHSVVFRGVAQEETLIGFYIAEPRKGNVETIVSSGSVAILDQSERRALNLSTGVDSTTEDDYSHRSLLTAPNVHCVQKMKKPIRKGVGLLRHRDKVHRVVLEIDGRCTDNSNCRSDILLVTYAAAFVDTVCVGYLVRMDLVLP